MHQWKNSKQCTKRNSPGVSATVGVDFVTASVSVVSMGACGMLDAGSFKEVVVVKWFMKTGIDDVSLVLLMIDVLVELVMELGRVDNGG